MRCHLFQPVFAKNGNQFDFFLKIPEFLDVLPGKKYADVHRLPFPSPEGKTTKMIPSSSCDSCWRFVVRQPLFPAVDAVGVEINRLPHGVGLYPAGARKTPSARHARHILPLSPGEPWRQGQRSQEPSCDAGNRKDKKKTGQGVLWNKQYVALWEAYLLGRRWQKGNRPESADFGQTRGGGLSGGNSGGLPHQRGIPGAAECQRDGKDRAETVNNIPRKQKRNPVGAVQ